MPPWPPWPPFSQQSDHRFRPRRCRVEGGAMGPVTTSCCDNAPSSVQMGWEFRWTMTSLSAQDRIRTRAGKAWKSTDESFFIFFSGVARLGYVYIYMCTYVGIYIYTLYVSSTVSIVTSCFSCFFFLTTLRLVSPPWSFNCRTPGVSWTASSPAGQRRCSWKRHLVEREVSSVQNHGLWIGGYSPNSDS